MNNENLVKLLVLALAVIGICIFVLIMALIIINAKEKRIKKEKEIQQEKKKVKKSEVMYTVEPIEDFMNFEKIEDNMIIQKKRKIFDGC